MSNKGFLTKKRERWLARFFDSLTNFGFIGELFDRVVFLGLIRGIDDLILDKKSNEKTIQIFEDYIELIEARRFDAANAFIADLIADSVKTPLGDDREKAIVIAALSFLDSYFQWAVNEAAKMAEGDGKDFIVND